jgi:hypothetical protein
MPSPDELESTNMEEGTRTLLSHFGSIFQVTELKDKTHWTALEKAVPFLDRRSSQRMQEALGARVGWVIVEDQYIDRDYRDTFSHIFSRRFATPSARCQRLHFFERLLNSRPTLEMLGDAGVQKGYLGYAVIRPTRPNGLGRMLVSPRIALSDVDGVEASLCQETVTLFGQKLSVAGFPYIGQDLDVTTCAQATLWMLRRYYSNRYRQYAETRPYELARLAAQHLRGDRSFPATGLSDWQMAEMLRSLGFSPMIYEKGKFTDFHQLLLSYLDSGVPLVLSFDRSNNGSSDTSGHAVACFGFRHRQETATAAGQSAALGYETKRLLVNDDNYPPYLEIGSVIPNHYPGAPTLDQVSSMIVPLPERISLLAEQFNTLVRQVLSDPTLGITKRSPTLAAVQSELLDYLPQPYTGGRSPADA